MKTPNALQSLKEEPWRIPSLQGLTKAVSCIQIPPMQQDDPKPQDETPGAEAETGATQEPQELDPWEQLEAEAAKWKELSLRTAAEMDNLRKRTARERDNKPLGAVG